MAKAEQANERMARAEEKQRAAELLECLNPRGVVAHPVPGFNRLFGECPTSRLPSMSEQEQGMR